MLRTDCKLLVAIHDVTPALETECRTLWRWCSVYGIVPALFVVPNWHGFWPLNRYPTFSKWLRDCAALGAEIFLHGERHDEQGLPRRWKHTWRALGRTGREGEFLTLDAAAARQRIQRGITALHRLDLSPIGFVAPAWLASDSSYHVAVEYGLRMSEDARGVHMHDRAMTLPAPAVRWSARTRVRAAVSSAVAEGRWRLQRSTPLMRLALHPSDLHHPVTARSAANALGCWSSTRLVWKYAEL